MSFPWPLVRSSLQPLDGFSTERFGIKLEAASFSREKFLHVACVSATLPLQQGSLTRIFFMADGSTGTPSLLLSIRGRLVEMSESFAALLGYRREELLTQHVSFWAPDIGLPEIDRRMKAFEIGTTARTSSST